MRKLIIAATSIVLVCSILFFSLGIFGAFQHRLADSLYGGKQAVHDIVIVGVDDDSLQQIGRWPWARTNFSVLIDNLGEPAVIGMDIAFLEKSDAKNDMRLAQSLKGKNIVLVSEYTGFKNDEQGNSVGIGLLLPTFENVTNITIKTGYANIVTDTDGVVRALNLNLGEERAFSSALYESYIKTTAPKDDRFLINYAGPPGTFTRYSAADVINGKVPKEAFKDKIVLFGAVARDFHDDAIVPTSNGVPMPGIEIHANALQTMLLHSSLSTIPDWVTILLIISIVILFAFLIEKFHIIVVVGVGIGIIISYIAIALFIFEHGLILNLIYVPFTVILSLLVLGSAHLMQARNERQKISEAFGKYVSPVLLDQIMQSEITLGGEKRELSILFCDIRGFTTLSEALSPEELVEVLNEYFDHATRAVMEHKGLVDKFIGDAIMAFWNAPITDEHHADHAIIAALAIRAVVENFNLKSKHKIRVGIGINTGDAIVGNVGSTQRLSYTAMGDSVNLASRLESLTKEYGVDILISESTKKKLKQEFVLREIDSVKVKGKKKAVVIYEVVCKKAGDLVYKNIEKYELALKLYYEGKFDLALKEFLTLSDGASSTMIERCKAFIENPPKDWDGAYTMDHK